MRHEDITEAINNLVPNAKYVLSGIDYVAINWFDSRTKPTLLEIEDEIKLLEKKRIDAVKRKKTTRANAVAKLSALGLTEEEINLL